MSLKPPKPTALMKFASTKGDDQSAIRTGREKEGLLALKVSLAVELMTLPWSVQVPGSIDGEVATPIAECLLPIAAVVAKYRTYRPFTSTFGNGGDSVGDRRESSRSDAYN